ncbi:MAG TPA: glycosyltransferase family 9 protein [Candidatus Eisenbacteria bacterium]|nr:glycosyltransferase family 9 protein [Candidatus Eisenbacteria bacterium]
MARGAALVVRFSSLGDVLLAAHLPSFLRDADTGRRVLFATKERYAPILRGHPDVARFFLLEDGSSDPAAPAPFGLLGGLGLLASGLRREGIDEVYDLHQNLRSSRLVSSLGQVRRVAPSKHGLRRRLMVHAKWLHPEPLPPLLGTYREIAGLNPAAPVRPWLREALGDSERARARARLGEGGEERIALLGVGARWETKRWPLERFVELGERLHAETGLSPRYAVLPKSAEASALRARLPEARYGAILEGSFRECAAAASFARVIVSNDSATLHLGAALGVPAVGIFGSTVPAFGFAPSGPRDAVVETALSCRPCSVHGRRRCPLGHHRCMRDIAPDLVLAAVQRVLAGAEAAPPAEARA